MATPILFRNTVHQNQISRFFQYLILIFATKFVLTPVVMIIFGALKSRGDFMIAPLHSFPYRRIMKTLNS
jgi:ABC-type glycerol-3-phosphate transport system permease component